MRLLIDLSTFTKSHNGGKDQVAYNLLRGFSKLELTSNIICVAKEEMVGKIKKIDKIKQTKWTQAARDVKNYGRHAWTHYFFSAVFFGKKDYSNFFADNLS